ncbi:hypothetical protein VOLCADRAFT_103456 [Volvox carteri f. nagariensis]|uniref:Uncharacterized protein n=1 Tax=Volvox carteri f. nagariensis TaxID=3068 RepID=D8TM09_VOLCA|nr:uncharacterized protein VOLCADRAFT_103456 [Volvox carteri f. nagariensis]EFJ51425.1 hypothetical protein VOLCADRAFT_103456 [Volvox carteri f. nagariensis]|eukprot:XP_002947377.1 hypothetical protein VOLCADRAFT_103456 [Volvox carteri f. nagariensis]
MLSAALRGAPAAIGSQPCPVQPRVPPVLQSQPVSRALASSYSSLVDEPIFESPRVQGLGIPLQSCPSLPMEGDVDVDASSSGDELEGDVFGAGGDLDDGPSASSSQTQHAHHLSLSTPNAAGPMASSVATSTVPILLSVGPSGEFTIGRAAMPTKGSMSDLQEELEQLTSFNAGRGSRPIGIPRTGLFAPSTYHPATGAFMQGFVPPHELAAASVQESDPMAAHSHRHKSIAERLRTAVFEQTGHMSLTTAAAFLQPGVLPAQGAVKPHEHP